MSQTRLYAVSASPDAVHQPLGSLDAAGLLPPPYRDEQEQVNALLLALGDRLNWLEVIDQARPWVEAVRKQPAPFWALESLLKESPITSAEGLALMRLAEALLRVPDTGTAALLAADQLGRARFAGEEKQSWITQISGRVLILSRRLLAEKETRNLVQRLGMNTVVTAAVRAIALLGRQFVLGQDLGEARRRAGEARKKQPLLSYSYDMLGEGARNSADAARYAAAYESALRALATQPGNGGPRERDGISIKLSALHPRFEEAQRGRLWQELFHKLQQLAELAESAWSGYQFTPKDWDRLGNFKALTAAYEQARQDKLGQMRPDVGVDVGKRQGNHQQRQHGDAADQRRQRLPARHSGPPRRLAPAGRPDERNRRGFAVHGVDPD